MTRTSRTAIGPKANSHHPQPVDEGSVDDGLNGRRSQSSSVELEDEIIDDEQTEATANQTATTTTTTSSVNTGQSRVQIIASDRPPANYVSGDNESVGSASKRRSNSQFTVPSVSRTSITTVSPSIQSSDAASTNTQPSSSLAPLQQTPTSGTGGGMDTASVITIASSSKHHSRRSFDTNASTMAIAPESLLSRGGSMDSLPNKSLTSSRHLSTASPSFKTDDDDVSIQSGAIVGGHTQSQSPVVDDASSSHWK